VSSKHLPGRFRRGRAGNHAPAPRRRRRWPWVLAGVFVIVGAVGAVGGVFALQAFEVRDNLLTAKAKLGAIPEMAAAGNQDKIEAVADDVLALTTASDEIVQSPLWDAASAVPVVGVNVAAVKSATEATHILVRDAMPPALQLLSTAQIDKLKVEGGGINLDPFRGAIEMLPAVSQAIADAESHVAAIDRKELLPVVDDAVGQLLDVMEQAGPALEMVEKYLPTLLQVAGSEGPRTYLVVFQNNAEIRATGGNGATSAVISVDNGKIQMREDETTAYFHLAGVNGWLEHPMPESTLSMYEFDFDVYAQNYTRTPDFPTSAQMYRSLWQTNVGGDIDGVIAIDPVVLANLLVATGPITLEDGSQLTSENVVKALLSDSYERFGKDGLAADAYFADVAGKAFETIASGKWDPMTMIEQLQKSIEEQRIYMWFPREAEQAISAELNVDGALATDNTKTTQVGAFLVNASYSKLEYYLSSKTDITCDPAARTVTTTVTLTSAVPGYGLSGYTLAWRNPELGLDRTTMILDVLSYAVPGGTITSNPENGDFYDWTRTGSEAGRQGKSITMTLAMGETKTVSFTSTLPEGELAPLEVRFTPTVTQTPVTIADTCDSLFG
jgi:hypothetical protein